MPNTVLPAPPAEGLAGEYFAWHGKDELRIQQCKECGHWTHPAQWLCPACSKRTLEWVRTSGRGHLFTWTRTHYQFSPDFPTEPPYICAIVQLEEGPKILTSLVGADETSLVIGMPVAVRFESRGDSKVAVFAVAD